MKLVIVAAAVTALIEDWGFTMKLIVIVAIAVLVGLGCKKDHNNHNDFSALRFTQEPQFTNVEIPQSDGSTLQGTAITGCLTNVSEAIQVRIRVEFHSDFEDAADGTFIALQQKTSVLLPGEEWCFTTNASLRSLISFQLAELSSTTMRLPGDR